MFVEYINDMFANRYFYIYIIILINLLFYLTVIELLNHNQIKLKIYHYIIIK